MKKLKEKEREKKECYAEAGCMVPTSYHLMQKMKDAIKKLRESLAGEDDGFCRFLLFMHHRRRGLEFDCFF